MTLPRDRRRPIEVDQRLYLWGASHEQGKGTHPFPPARVVVHTKKLPHGQKLVAVVAVDIARPAMVANLIRRALRDGWKPNEPGPDFVLGPQQTEDVLHLDRSGPREVVAQIIVDQILAIRASESTEAPEAGSHDHAAHPGQ